jgi:hypothetical protein
MAVRSITARIICTGYQAICRRGRSRYIRWTFRSSSCLSTFQQLPIMPSSKQEKGLIYSVLLLGFEAAMPRIRESIKNPPNLGTAILKLNSSPTTHNTIELYWNGGRNKHLNERNNNSLHKDNIRRMIRNMDVIQYHHQAPPSYHIVSGCCDY